MPLWLLFSFVLFTTTEFTPANAAEPNLCDEKGTIQCENYQTCCPFASGQFGCCPFTAANCCPSSDFCCPAGFRCGNSSCLRMDI